MDTSSYNHSVTEVHDSTGVFDYPDSPGTSSSYKEELVEDLSESVELFNQTSTLSSEKVSTIHYQCTCAVWSMGHLIPTVLYLDGFPKNYGFKYFGQESYYYENIKAMT